MERPLRHTKAGTYHCAPDGTGDRLARPVVDEAFHSFVSLTHLLVCRFSFLALVPVPFTTLQGRALMYVASQGMLGSFSFSARAVCCSQE